jgi:hypothetical protein
LKLGGGGRVRRRRRWRGGCLEGKELKGGGGGRVREEEVKRQKPGLAAW